MGTFFYVNSNIKVHPIGPYSTLLVYTNVLQPQDQDKLQEVWEHTFFSNPTDILEQLDAGFPFGFSIAD